MLSLEESKWAELSDAYGPASKIPVLLKRAMQSPEPHGDYKDEPWFSLWSALCHQGTVYTASYAAVPHLINFALSAKHPIALDFVELPRAIEESRMNGNGPEVPEELQKDYFTTVINSITKYKPKRVLIAELCSESETGSWMFWSSFIKTEAECQEIIDAIKDLAREKKIYATEYTSVKDGTYAPITLDEKRLKKEVQRSMRNDVDDESFYWFLATPTGQDEYTNWAKEYWTQERQEKELEKWRSLSK